jgi:protein-tyrosine-phosphatase
MAQRSRKIDILFLCTGNSCRSQMAEGWARELIEDRVNPLDDPPRLAASARTEQEALNHYRRVRDEIRDLVRTLPDSLETLLKNQRP